MAIVPIPEKPVLPQPGPIADQAVLRYISGLSRSLSDILAITARRANASVWIDPGDDQTANKYVAFVGSANKVKAVSLPAPADMGDLPSVGTGMIAKTDATPGAQHYAARTITGTSLQVAVANGDGVAGNPTISLPPIVRVKGDATFTIGGVQVADNTGSLFGGITGWSAGVGDVVLFSGGVFGTIHLLTAGDVDLMGGKLKFPATQSPSADPNTLDDYEEGNWTPTYGASSGAFGAITYNSRRYGRYVKVGKKVFFQGLIATDSLAIGTASGNVLVFGLPFSTVSGIDFVAVSVGYSSGFPVANTNPEAGILYTGATGWIPSAKAVAASNSSLLLPSSMKTGSSSSANFIVFAGNYTAVD